MADDRDKDTPSLEPPSLFGRKKKPKKVAPPVAVVHADATPERTTPPPVVAQPVLATPVVVEPAVDDSPTTIFDDTSEPSPDPAPTPGPADVEEGRPTPITPRAPREPWLTGTPAAVVTGLLVGVLIVAATAGSLQLCTKVKGTSSCGGPGFFLLVAIMIVAVLLGAALLRAARVPEPGSTSFLAVGLLSVLALLFLVGSIFAWWMIIVIPLVSVATFLLSHWVTTTYIDPADDASDPAVLPEQHDLR